MSHFFHVVLVRPPEPDAPMSEDAIEAMVNELMAPYDENIRVAPYRDYLDEEDVACMRTYYEKETGRLSLAQLAEKMPDWRSAPGGIDDQGRLYSLSTYNPSSKWDWWSFGGRWNGVMRNASRSSVEDGGFNFADEYRQLPENMLPVAWIDHTVECHSVLTPDGVWHEQGRGGWFGMVADPKDEDEWDNEVVTILRQHTDCIAVGVDFHI